MDNGVACRGPRDRFYAQGAPESFGPEPGRTCCGARRRRGGAGRGALAEPAVIAALISNGGHGYDLRRSIAEMTAGAIDVDQGGLYRVLRRLEDEGYVVSTWVEAEAGPQRREYQATESAAEVAREWIAHLRERERTSGLLAALLEEALGESDGRQAAE